MRTTLLATGLSALLGISTTTADDIPDNYAVSRFHSYSTYEQVHDLEIQAVNGTFRLGGSATRLCPDGVVECDSPDMTALYNYTSLYVNYPEGQKTYVHPDGQWRYTEPVVPDGGDGSPTIPPGSTIYGFYFYPCQGVPNKSCYTPGYGHGGWMGCPPLEEDDDRRWIVYDNIAANESVPTGSTADCRWFDAVSIDVEEEAEVYLVEPKPFKKFASPKGVGRFSVNISTSDPDAGHPS
ncbi:hypothetical protein FQN54_001453 [Arachnomyces sp. PD_36]|nr:hypothetical protein FQN54_001453 [Arachnomyces sp. PD_36]